MKLSFPAKLILFVFTFIVASVAGSAGLVFYLYQKDKVSSLLETEVQNTLKTANGLESLILMANVISMDRVQSSKQIIALFENPCSTTPTQEISEAFKNQIAELEVNPKDWISSLDVFRTCQLVKADIQNNPAGHTVYTVQNSLQLMIPYISILTRVSNSVRLAIISMDRLASSASNTLFLINAQNKILWTSDGDDYLKTAFLETGLETAELNQIAEKAIKTRDHQIIKAGHEGLLSYAPVSTEWALISLSHGPSVMRPIYYAIRQSVLLTVSILFFSLFLAKLGAQLVVKPLNELRESAEKLGRGDFSNRLEVAGSDEFSTVKQAFNRMIDEIIKLIDEAKVKAGLENELNLAKKVQHMLIPSPLITTKTIVMNSFMINASQCGGDWWGYIEVPDQNKKPRLIVMIGDATGHGVPSALITAAVRGAVSVVSSIIEQNPAIADDPCAVNRYLNRSILDASRTEISMTFFVAVLDTEKQIMRCSNAGHNNPYLITKGSGSAPKIIPIGSPSIPLGYQLDVVYDKIDEYPWNPGSKLFLYTDGLIECVKGDQVLFDRKSLRKILAAHGGMGGKSLLNKIMFERSQKILDLPQEDDITAVLCEYAEGSSA